MLYVLPDKWVGEEWCMFYQSCGWGMNGVCFTREAGGGGMLYILPELWMGRNVICFTRVVGGGGMLYVYQRGG